MEISSRLAVQQKGNVVGRMMSCALIAFGRVAKKSKIPA
jgi:hypothetical protein